MEWIFASNVYVTGWTRSIDFPITPGVFQTVFGGFIDAFVAKIGESCTIVCTLARTVDIVASLPHLKPAGRETLTALLNAALTQAKQRDTIGAVRHLQEFIRVVNRLVGLGELLPEIGAALTEAAEYGIRLLRN